MDRPQAIELIRESPLAEFADLLSNQMLPSARLVVVEDGAVEDGGVGARSSHFGGLPILPRDFEWPRWERDSLLRSDIARWEERFKKNPRATGLRDFVVQMRQQLSQGPQPLAFLCQLFLRDLNAYVPLDGWPSDGSLAFFYDPAQNWGFDPEARGHCRVVYVSEHNQQIPVPAPAGLPEEALFPRRGLKFMPEWTLPTRLDIDGEDLSIWGNEDYAALLQQLMPVSDEREPIHRCGGHPQEVQGEMRLECQLVTNGLYCGDATGYEDPRRASLEPGAADWQLLLQIDSDEDRLGWMWGDAGRVYFWIRRQDLAASDFEGAWAVLQCY